MQIFVRSINNTFVVNVDRDENVADLKAKIEDKEFIPSDIQRIVSGTDCLTSGKLGILLEDLDTVTLYIDIDGGMRAKWRKKRMRRLRRKRRKMRDKAR